MFDFIIVYLLCPLIRNLSDFLQFYPQVFHILWIDLNVRSQNDDRHTENMVIRNKCIVGAAICRLPCSEYNLCG